MSTEKDHQHTENQTNTKLPVSCDTCSTCGLADQQSKCDQKQQPSVSSSERKPVVYIIYYSMYGHIKKLADHIKVGIEKNGCEAKLFQVQETLPQEVLDKMHASPKDPNVPIIDASKLPEADGLMFGIPTRFGAAPAQMKNLFDACGQLWMEGTLYGKPAGMFVSTGTLGGGQETTALTTLTFLAHLGMIYVPLGYKNQKIMSLDEIHGGSPYGAGTIAGNGERQPTELELNICETQGYEFANVVKKLTDVNVDNKSKL